MLGSTPPFPNPPLVLTVLEVRYPEIAGGFGADAQRGLREAVLERFPLRESYAEERVTVDVEAPTRLSFGRTTFPRFYTRDQTTALVVKNDAFVLETTAYAGWKEHFRSLAREVVAALEKASQPDGVLRIGLRYIDEIRVPGIESAPGDWRDYIDGHLLAAADPDFIPASLELSTWEKLVHYRTTTGTLAVRYGPQEGYAINPRGPTRRRNPPPPGLFFLLDSDSYWVSEDVVPEFESDWILERCDLLHEPAREFFKIAVTDKLRDEVFNQQEEDAI